MKDAGHLIRVAFLLCAGMVLFLLVRRMIVPVAFGQYGHYRPGALDDNRARPVSYAGHETCEACHPEVLEKKKTGRHAAIACEACHGPQAKHADDPAALKPPRPNTAVLCAQCHERLAAKPKFLPQVVTKEHSGGVACGECHQPHTPKIGA